MNETLSIILNFLLASGLVGTLFFYNSKKRKANAEADNMEITNEITEVDRLEARLKSRDDKVDALYIELRREQTEKYHIMGEKHKLALEVEILKIKRCDTRACANRIPPSEY